MVNLCVQVWGLCCTWKAWSWRTGTVSLLQQRDIRRENQFPDWKTWLGRYNYESTLIGIIVMVALFLCWRSESKETGWAVWTWIEKTKLAQEALKVHWWSLFKSFSKHMHLSNFFSISLLLYAFIVIYSLILIQEISGQLNQRQLDLVICLWRHFTSYPRGFISSCVSD